MAMSPQAIQFLLRLLARKVPGSSPLAKRGAIAGLAKGKSSKNMSEMMDRKAAGSSARRRGDVYDGNDYPSGYRGPDPGSINEMEEIKALIKNLNLEGTSRIKGAGRMSGGREWAVGGLNPFRSQYKGDHMAMSKDSKMLNQLLSGSDQDIDIGFLMKLIRGE